MTVQDKENFKKKYFLIFLLYLIFKNLLNPKLYKLKLFDLKLIYDFKFDIREFLNLQKKDKKIINTILKNNLQKENFSFIEVGAGDSYLSGKILSKFKNARVFGFDPRDDLLKYKAINKKYKNFKFFNCALSNKKKKSKFYIYNDKNLSSFKLLKRNQYISKDNLSRNKLIKVTRYKKNTLNEFAKYFNKNIILSIDVQGIEKEVILGSSYFFKKKYIKILILEFNNDLKNNVQFINKFLKKNNFKLVASIPGYKNGQKVIEYDKIFVLKN